MTQVFIVVACEARVRVPTQRHGLTWFESSLGAKETPRISYHLIQMWDTKERGKRHALKLSTGQHQKNGARLLLLNTV